jgi:hypothetical protein
MRHITSDDIKQLVAQLDHANIQRPQSILVNCMDVLQSEYDEYNKWHCELFSPKGLEIIFKRSK